MPEYKPAGAIEIDEAKIDEAMAALPCNGCVVLPCAAGRLCVRLGRYVAGLMAVVEAARMYRGKVTYLNDMRFTEDINVVARASSEAKQALWDALDATSQQAPA